MITIPTIGRAAAALLLALTLGVAPAASPPRETAVLAGGCFWGIEAVFEHVKGVIDVRSGYAGGAAATAQYRTVGTGTTGHAESVEIVFDPAVVSYATLLTVFFTVAHDPTQLNRQGPDVGAEYRSALFYANADQQRIARAVIDSLTAARTWPRPIVTEVAPLRGFFVAETYHQDYARLHPFDPYIVINDRPKVRRLREQFPELFREEQQRASR